MPRLGYDCRMSLRVSLFILFLIGIENSAWAQADLAYGGYYRSYPVSGSAELNLGYSLKLWGEDGDPFLGFFRLASDIEGVPDYLASTVKAEFFPVAVLGFRAGQTFSQSHLDYESF